jgi:hypothetical protein
MSLDNRIKIYNFLKNKKEIIQTSQNDWMSKWFANENKVYELYTYLNGNNKNKVQYYTKSLGDFYKNHCCDLFPNSQYCSGTPATTQTPVTADVNTGVKNVSTSFSCIVKNTFWSGRIKTTSDPNHIVYKLPGDQEYNFYANGSFIYRDIPPYRTNIKGTWVCDGSSDFVINMEDDSKFESKVGKWKENVSAQPVTDLKEKSEKRRGTYLKMGDKNPKVGELQKCLIDKGFKNISKDGHIDNKFGMRTKQSVMDFQSKNGLKVSGVVDKKTWELLGGTSTLEEQKIIRKIVHQNLKSLIK